MVIGCSASTIDRYTEEGTFISSASMVGGAANDVDIDMAPVDLVMNGTFVEQGRLLLVNGEVGVAEIYAIDEVTNVVIDTLVPAFGNSHVVGGSYHPQRGTFFLVQDNVPTAALANRVAEIDAMTGAVIQEFSVLPHFDVNYGDLDISPISGHLFIVSSAESTIAEFTPEGVFVTEHALPAGVSGLSGIALDNDLEGAWVCNTGGLVYKLGDFPMSIETHAHDRTLIHPNPATDQIWITPGNARTPARMELVDQLGRTVRIFDQLPAGPRGMVQADVRGVAPGRYVLLVHGQDGGEAHHLVIAR